MMTMLKGRRIGLAAKVNTLIVGSILATVLGTGALTLRNMTAESFQTYYPQWREFEQYKDPQFSSSFWRRVVPGGKEE